MIYPESPLTGYEYFELVCGCIFVILFLRILVWIKKNTLNFSFNNFPFSIIKLTIYLFLISGISGVLSTMVAGLSNEKILKIDNCNGKTSTSYREELLGLSHRIDAGITLSSYIQASYSIDFKISAGLTLNAKPISLTLDATGYVKIAATLKIPFVIDQTEEIANKSFNENKKIWSK